MHNALLSLRRSALCIKKTVDVCCAVTVDAYTEFFLLLCFDYSICLALKCICFFMQLNTMNNIVHTSRSSSFRNYPPSLNLFSKPCAIWMLIFRKNHNGNIGMSISFHNWIMNVWRFHLHTHTRACTTKDSTKVKTIFETSNSFVSD